MWYNKYRTFVCRMFYRKREGDWNNWRGVLRDLIATERQYTYLLRGTRICIILLEKIQTIFLGIEVQIGGVNIEVTHLLKY